MGGNSIVFAYRKLRCSIRRWRRVDCMRANVWSCLWAGLSCLLGVGVSSSWDIKLCIGGRISIEWRPLYDLSGTHPRTSALEPYTASGWRDWPLSRNGKGSHLGSRPTSSLFPNWRRMWCFRIRRWSAPSWSLGLDGYNIPYQCNRNGLCRILRQPLGSRNGAYGRGLVIVSWTHWEIGWMAWF